MSAIKFYPAAERGHANHGWLDAYHSFSFAGFYDPAKIRFGALRVLNDDTVDGGMGFGKHPHDNMEIITIILEGTLQHKDSMGNGADIKAGEVQVMSAGTGVFHSEYNPDPEHKVRLFQIWIFPEKKNLEPRYDQRSFDAQQRINRWQPLVSPMDKDDEGLKIHQQAWISRATIEKGQQLSYDVHTVNHGIYVMVVNGALTIEGKELRQRDAIGISDKNGTTVTASETSDVLLLEIPMMI